LEKKQIERWKYYKRKWIVIDRVTRMRAAETIAKMQAEIRDMRSMCSVPKEVGNAVAPNKSVSTNYLKEEITRLYSQGSTIANLEEQLENVQKSIESWKLESRLRDLRLSS
jgi:centromeric protein E